MRYEVIKLLVYGTPETGYEIDSAMTTGEVLELDMRPKELDVIKLLQQNKHIDPDCRADYYKVAWWASQGFVIVCRVTDQKPLIKLRLISL